MCKVITDCFDESTKILVSENEANLRFLYVGQVGMSLRENDRVLLIVTFQRVES